MGLHGLLQGYLYFTSLTYSVATYRAETWTLTVTEENALRMFERKIIRKIYGQVMENMEDKIQ
jgi:hypothetical protein